VIWRRPTLIRLRLRALSKSKNKRVRFSWCFSSQPIFTLGLIWLHKVHQDLARPHFGGWQALWCLQRVVGKGWGRRFQHREVTGTRMYVQKLQWQVLFWMSHVKLYILYKDALYRLLFQIPGGTRTPKQRWNKQLLRPSLRIGEKMMVKCKYSDSFKLYQNRFIPNVFWWNLWGAQRPRLQKTKSGLPL